MHGALHTARIVGATILMTALALALVPAGAQRPTTPWEEAFTKGPGPNAALLELVRGKGPAPGGGMYVPNWDQYRVTLESNRKGQAAYMVSVDHTGDGRGDTAGLFFVNRARAIRICQDGDILSNGLKVLRIARGDERLIVTDEGTVYFMAAVPADIPNWPRGGIFPAILGWDARRGLFSVVGPENLRLGDGRIITSIASISNPTNQGLTLLSPGRLGFFASTANEQAALAGASWDQDVLSYFTCGTP